MSYPRWTSTVATRIRPGQMEKMLKICDRRDLKIAELAREFVNEGIKRELQKINEA